MRKRLKITGAIDSASKELLITRFNRRVAIIVTCNLCNVLSAFAIFGYFGGAVVRWFNGDGLVLFYVLDDILPFDVVRYGS